MNTKEIIKILERIPANPSDRLMLDMVVENLEFQGKLNLYIMAGVALLSLGILIGWVQWGR